jgi:hypothetical protein
MSFEPVSFELDSSLSHSSIVAVWGQFTFVCNFFAGWDLRGGGLDSIQVGAGTAGLLRFTMMP